LSAALEAIERHRAERERRRANLQLVPLDRCGNSAPKTSNNQIILVDASGIGANGGEVLTLRPLPGVDGTRALRAALKILLRRFGLKAVKIGEVRYQCRYWG
jgi:hypothetical protein